MIELIPAIDIIDGKCVRLSQGDYAQKTVYSSQPEEMAKLFEGCGVKRLHVVDLDGAKSKHIVNYKVLERIATQTNLVIDFGGGLKSDEDLRIAFESGAAMVTGGSIAVKEPETFLSWINRYGADKIILGADAKDKKIAVSGWLENSDLELIPFVEEYLKLGVKKCITTDISKDGMLKGPSIELYKEMQQVLPELYIIASGGVSSMADIEALDEASIPAVIFGKAFYEGRITIKDIENYIIANK